MSHLATEKYSDYLKLAREAREAYPVKTFRYLAELVPALCDAIEAQAAHITRLDEELGFARNKRDGAHAHAEEQATEIERLRAVVSDLCCLDATVGPMSRPDLWTVCGNCQVCRAKKEIGIVD